MSLLSYRNTIINQSVCVFSLSYFLKWYNDTLLRFNNPAPLIKSFYFIHHIYTKLIKCNQFSTHIVLFIIRDKSDALEPSSHLPRMRSNRNRKRDTTKCESNRRKQKSSLTSGVLRGCIYKMAGDGHESHVFVWRHLFFILRTV